MILNKWHFNLGLTACLKVSLILPKTFNGVIIMGWGILFSPQFTKRRSNMKRSLYLMFSVLVLASMMLAACAPAATPEPTAVPVPTDVPATVAPAATDVPTEVATVAATEAAATAVPLTATAAPAPACTPLATLPTVAAGKPGSADDPIVITFVPSGDTGKITKAGTAIADCLAQMTGLAFKIEVGTTFAASIEAMGAEKAQVGFLNTFSVLLAEQKYQIVPALANLRKYNTNAVDPDASLAGHMEPFY